MAKESLTNTPDNSSLVFEYLKLNIDVFKHESDSFLKGFALYLAVVGTLSGFVFSDRVNNQTRKYLAVIIAVGSILAFIGCAISLKQFNSMDNLMRGLCARLALEPVPLAGPKRILMLKLFISGLFVVAGVIFIIKVG